MKFRALLLLLPLASSVQAQQPSQTPAVRSPEVSADRRVTFRVRAPNASKVTVFCECLTNEPAMTKGDDGVWSVTVGPIEPDLYEYHFTVDGVDNLDQRNPVVKYNSRPNLIESVLEVPGSAPMFYDIKPVPHGKVEIRYYPSKTTGATRRVFVYTPPNYERSNTRLPVLYLLHGGDGDETVWTQFGRANLILDNLIAEKKAAPMVVVMPFAYAYPWHAGVAGEKQRADFEKDLLTDLIPFVQSNYRVSSDRESRALAGLSMGGSLTLAIGPRHLDTFSRLAIFSSGGGQNLDKTYADVAANAKNVNAQLRLFWIGVGTEDGAMAGAKRTSDFLNAAGIKHIYKTTPGAHTWIVWRKYLNEVAPQIFPANHRSTN
jgi:enterochelin esterase family protein